MNSFSFEGNYKAKRNINLGGVRAQEDKKRLLEKAQRERKAREAERVRVRNATRIQSFYRGRRAACQTRRLLQESFSQKFAELRHALQNDDTSSDKAQLLVATMRLQLGMMNENDLESLQTATPFIEWVLAPDNNVITLPWLADDDEIGDIWEWQLKLLLSKITITSNNQTSNDIMARLNLMRMLIDRETYTRNGLSPQIATTIQSSMATHLLQRKNIYSIIHDYFLNQQTKQDNETQLITQILINVMKIDTSTPRNGIDSITATNAFVTKILTIRSLITRISRSSFVDIINNIGMGSILESILQSEKYQVFEQTHVVGLLENVIELRRSTVMHLQPQEMTKFVRVLSALLLKLSPQFFILDEEDQDMIDSDDDSDEEERMNLDITRDVADDLNWKDLDPNEQECLSQLHDPTFLSNIIEPLVDPSVTQINSQQASIMMAAEIFNFLIIRWPAYRDKIFGLLLYNLKVPRGTSKQNFVHQLFSIWLSGHVSRELKKLTDASSSSHVISYIQNPEYCGEWNIIILLCELYHRSLITLGDDEFFKPEEGKNPLNTEEILDLSLDLKSITFALFWNTAMLDPSSAITASIDAYALRTSVTRLIQHLHARDSRRPFCPPNHWFVSGLNKASFRETAIADEFSIETEVQDARQPRRAPSKLKMARISPHLGVLNNIPFVLPFEDRVQVFRMFIRNDRKPQYAAMGVPEDMDIDNSFFPPVARVTIRRDHVFEDGFTHLYGLGADLRKKVAISFVDEFGLLEAGVDGGGVFKEFLTTLARQAFDTKYGLFMVTQDQLLYPNSSKYAREPTQLAFFEFLGLIIGKALYEGILVEAAFAGFFLSKCLGKMNYLDDLPSLDYELYKGLINLKNYDGNVEDLCLDFSITDNDVESSEIIDLVPNGRNIPVTNENRIRYIYLVANYRMNIQIGKQSKAFFRGLSTIIDPKWIRMFNQKELQILLGGATIPIDIDDLQANTVYSGYTEDEDIIQNLWAVLRQANNEERRKFVKFVTSCSRPPLLGFKELNPQFCIRNAGADDTRLPTSSTCVNLLKLPRFSNVQILKQKLLYAINAEAGFDLS